MDQRTCCSYSLPCFSFPVLVDGFDGDVVSGDGLQAPHDSRGGHARDPEGHFPPSSAGNILQPVVAHPAWRWRPCDFHGVFCLLRNDQLFMSRQG